MPEQIDGNKTVIIYESGSGVIFWIAPLSLPTLRAIQIKARSVFPDVDPTPYRYPEENAFGGESQLTPAEDDPEYIQKVAEVEAERSKWTKRAVFEYAAKMPKYHTRELLLEAFREQLTELRKIADLPEDDYEAVMFHIVLSWNQVGEDSDGKLAPVSNDFNRIYQLAIQTVALEPSEVAAGIKFFRPKVSRA